MRARRSNNSEKRSIDISLTLLTITAAAAGSVIQEQRRFLSLIRILAFVALFAAVIYVIQVYGVSHLRDQVQSMGIWAPLGIILLRFISIVIPALPSTAYSLLAGALLGFQQGIVVIILADLLACSTAFFLSRRYGRSLVKKLVGERFMFRVEKLSKRHLERNFFLMTGFLMTGLFDFVCYGVGLTSIRWTRFAPALVISIVLSDPPIVALGAGLLDGGKIILGFALMGILGLAIVTGIVQQRGKKEKLI